MGRLVPVVVIAVWATAAAAKPSLAPYDAGSFSVAMPRGWTMTSDASKGIVVAQQDPKRKDAAQAIVMVLAQSPMTDDQLIDAMVGQAAGQIKIIKRGPNPSGGKLVVAEGVVDGLQVRLAAIAVSGGGGLLLALVIAKSSELDGLGGLDLAQSMLASIKPAGSAAPPPASGPDPVMTPQYDSYKSLIIPPPYRTITQADLVGEWSNDDQAVRDYAIRTGNYTGSDAIATAETWVIDAKGNLTSKFRSVTVGSSGAHGTKLTTAEKIAISPDGVITLVKPSSPGHTTMYLLRGWFAGADVVIMRINGPYYDSIPDDVRPNGRAPNLNKLWVRKR